MKSLNTTIRNKINNVPRNDDKSRTVKGIESVIRSKYNKKNDDSFSREQQIVKKIIDESINFDDLSEEVIEIVEGVMELDKVKFDQRKSLSALIANAMVRNPRKTDVKTLVLLLAAITLVSNSDGKDTLIQLARRLYSAGMSSR